MTTLHATNSFNVKATINNAYATALAAFTGLPSWMTAPAMVYDWPEIAKSTPCFSFIHLTGSSSDNYQGRGDGAGNSAMRNTGLLEISAWVSRDQKSASGQDVWSPRLEYMKGMVEHVNAKLSVIRTLDYTVSLTAPTATAYKVNMGDLSEMQVADDPNPAIRRKRFLVNYFWDQRA